MTHWETPETGGWKNGHDQNKKIMGTNYQDTDRTLIINDFINRWMTREQIEKHLNGARNVAKKLVILLKADI